MNILVLSWRDPKHPLAGGAEQVMHQHMLGWINGGHRVTLFSSRFNGSQAQENIEGVEVIRGGNQNFLDVQTKAFFYYLKNRNRFDFLVDCFHGYPFFTPLYSKTKKLAVIQETAREVWFLNPLVFPINYLVGAIGYITEPFVFKLYKNVDFVTGSNSAKNDVAGMGIKREKITVVPHGVIVKLPKKKVTKEKIQTVTFLGVLSKDKGIEGALICFSELLKLGKFQFWVIGRPETQDYLKELERLAKKLKVENSVKFWGFVSQEKKFELLMRSHILVNPSVREGWGLVNIEANAVGTPVVSYKSQGLVDSVKEGESGIFTQENTPVSMASQIEKVLTDERGYAKLCAGAVKWAGNFSWEASRKLSLKVIESIAKRNN